MRRLVQERLGSVAVPAKFIVAGALPETHSGKFMRRLLQALLAGQSPGDLGAVKNPECIGMLQEATRRAFTTPAAGSVTEALATVFDVLYGLVAADSIAPSEPFMQMGIDSLSAAHLVAELQQRTGLHDVSNMTNM